MKTLSLFAILLVNLSLFASSENEFMVLRGGISSGGGASVVCFSGGQNRHISSVEMLDLFEAPFLYGLNINESNTPYETQLQAAIDRTKSMPEVYWELMKMKDHIFTIKKFLGSNVVIRNITDLGDDEPVVVPIGCEVIGAGFYSKSGKLFISDILFNNMSETHKAAFFLHEITYAVYRGLKMTPPGASVKFTSALSREFTANLVASNPSDLALFKDDFSWATRVFPRNIFNGASVQQAIIEPRVVLNNLTISVKLLSDDYNENESFRVFCHSGRQRELAEIISVFKLNKNNRVVKVKVPRGCQGVGVDFDPSNFGKVTDWVAEIKDSQGNLITQKEGPWSIIFPLYADPQ